MRQNKRLLHLSFPRDDGPPGVLLVASRLDAFEGLSRDFEFKLEVLSDTDDIEQKTLLGKMATVSLVRTDGGLRYFNGYIFDIGFVKNDGGFCYYEMILRPWLALLELRRDNFLFHDQSISQQTTQIFERYRERDWRMHRLGDDDIMTEACQYAETDYNYLHRRWEERGWSYHYEHCADGHTLVLSGDSTACEAIDGDGQLVWQGGDHQGSGVQTFSPRRRLAPTRYSIGSADFKQQRLTHLEQEIDHQQGAISETMAALDVYEYTGNHGVKSRAGGEHFLRLRGEEIKAKAKYFQAGGDDGRTQAGLSFTLSGRHGPLRPAPGKDSTDHEFLILEVRHSARNNYENNGTVLGARELGGPEQGQRAARYSNTFLCMRKKVAWRPGRGFNSVDTKVYRLETATVVCPAGQEIFTDQFGRVQVQFNWQRKEGASAWLRLSSGSAGQNYGQIALPRAGEQVWISWLDGNPDHPVIIGRAHDAANMPPRFNHTGGLPDDVYLSGMLSKEVKGQGYNQLRLDDTPGRVNLQILSSHAQSQVNLGHLSHPGSASQYRPRGNGFEVATNESGAIRTARSLLLTAWKRLDAWDGQLGCAEHLELMQAGLDLFKSMGAYAAGHMALGVDAQPQAGLRDDIAAAPGGSNTDPQGQGGKPTLSITAPDGIALTTAKTVLAYAGANIDMLARGHLQYSAGHAFNVNAGHGISLFAHRDGVRQIAHYGTFLMQSQHDDMRIDSAKDLKITADGTLTITAEQLHLIAKDGSHIKIGGGVTLGTGAGIALKSVQCSHDGPATMHAEMPYFSGDGNEPAHWIALHYLDPQTAQGIAGAGYEIHLQGGPTVTGKLDENGKARHENVMNKPVEKVLYLPRTPEQERHAGLLDELSDA